MQTSGNSSTMKTRTGAAAVVGLAIAVTSSWIACSPGEPDCTRVDCHPSGGGSGGDMGGSGGGPGGSSGGDVPPPVSDCAALGITSTGTQALTDFETKFISMRCGQAMCHGPNSVFPPRDLDKPDKIRPTINGVKAGLNCRSDFYINKTDYTKSFILAKITSDNPTMVTCPSGGMGGTRMPNKTDPMPMPTIPGDKLMAGEIACFTWYIQAVAGLK
jgi:hypothetical protein